MIKTVSFFLIPVILFAALIPASAQRSVRISKPVSSAPPALSGQQFLDQLKATGQYDLLMKSFKGAGQNDAAATNAGPATSTFAAKQDFATGASPLSVAVGDLNGDGKLDLVIANSGDNTVSVLLNTTAPGAATPSFAAKHDFATGIGPQSVALGDLNGDGKLDLVVANDGADTVSVLLNTTAPTAAGVSVSGRVMTSDGRGLRNAVLVLTDQQGVSRQVITGPFGYYRFDDVQSGETYVIGVASKLYRFGSRVLSVSDELTGVDFVATVAAFQAGPQIKSR